jgi:hypothetical protein
MGHLLLATSDEVVQQFRGEGAGVVHFGVNSLWVASATANTVTRYDPKRIAATLASIALAQQVPSI